MTRPEATCDRGAQVSHEPDLRPEPFADRVAHSVMDTACCQSTYWSGVAAKPSGSETPVAWFGQ